MASLPLSSMQCRAVPNAATGIAQPVLPTATRTYSATAAATIRPLAFYSCPAARRQPECALLAVTFGCIRNNDRWVFPMRKILITTIAALILFAGAARADNAACWGDESRGDITCSKITEPLLLGLRGQTIDAVRKALKARGRDIEKGLHYLSNYSRGEKAGSGDVNVAFEDGRATIVNASVDSPSKTGEFEFIWNAYAAPALGSEIDRTTKDFRRSPFCSDFSGQPMKCTGMTPQPTS